MVPVVRASLGAEAIINALNPISFKCQDPKCVPCLVKGMYEKESINMQTPRFRERMKRPRLGLYTNHSESFGPVASKANDPSRGGLHARQSGAANGVTEIQIAAFFFV